MAQITYNSEREIHVTVGNGSSGNVYIITPDGTASLSGFQYIPKPKTGNNVIKDNRKGKMFIDGHYENVKRRKWADTTKREKVWGEEHTEGNRRIEGHYEHRRIPSGYWQEYEEKIWVPGHYEN